MSDVVDITRSLIELDSQSRVGNVAIADFIAGLVDPMARDVERLEYTDSGGQHKVSVVVQIGEGEGGLALSSHMDPVPGLDWPGDPFVARTDGDRLYVTRPLTLLLSTDEETDTEGALRIARDSKILAAVRPDYCIVAEPTDLHVANAHKAAVTFIAETEGWAAHSSTGEGINANNRMIPF